MMFYLQFIFLSVIVFLLALLRYYLEKQRYSASLKCPECGKPLQRIPRQAWEHILSFFLPVRSYGCENVKCNWQGLRIKPLKSSKFGKPSMIKKN